MDAEARTEVAGSSPVQDNTERPLFSDEENANSRRDDSLDAAPELSDTQRLLEERQDAHAPVAPLPSGLTIRLYTSHFLSTWNSRMFEFAAVLFLAEIYPHTLRPMSVYAVVRGLSAVIFAEAVGAYIDTGHRLAVVRHSIIGQRLAVAVSCCVFWSMLANPDILGVGIANLKTLLLAVTIVAACVEKLCSVMNLVSVERDWIVVITDGDESGRRLLNARMRRIDLFCKLLAPLTISLVISVSVLAAIWAIMAINVTCVVVEYYCIAVVYRRVPGLRRQFNDETSSVSSDTSSIRQVLSSFPNRLCAGLYKLLPFSSLPFYVRHRAFLPSLSLAILYLTVLSFSGQMVTFLLSVGFTPLGVGLIRTFSSMLELSATWVAPALIARIGDVRAGIWSLSWQSLWLTAGVLWFWGPGAHERSLLTSATGLAFGVAMSRVGLWSFDLCAQSIVQEDVEVEHRGAFSTAEAAFQNIFEVLSYVTTMVFARPDQFRWPVIVSIFAIYTAATLYAAFVRQRRGHLFHSPIPPAQRWLDKTFRWHELTERN